MAPRRRCPVCGSKQWHKEPASGLITCSEGHVLQNYRNETREVTDLGPHALRKRTLKSGRKRKERQSKADPKLYHGDRARYHYFQCLQLILRIQVASLTELWGLPKEFEIICRDIWALHLSLLPNPPPPEPLLFSRDVHGTEPSNVRRTPPPEEGSDDERARETDGEQDAAQDHASRPSSPSSSSSENDDGDDDDLEMEVLMQENSDTSSSDEDDAPRPPRADAYAVAKRKHPSRVYDAPASNVAVLMVACWTLRLPVTYMDFIRLIEEYKLQYLDPVRFLPWSLASHLTKHTVHALSPHHAPTVLHLHGLTSRLAKLMYLTYDVHTPEMNSPPTLWRAVRSLCGTPTLYALTKKVARIASIPFTLHRALTSPLKHEKKRDPTWHKFDSIVPEVSLIASVIVVMKLVYGLDDNGERLPREKDDPACALPRLSDLLKCIEEVDTKSADHFPFSASSPLSVIDMDERSLDQYIDFCETALLPHEDRQSEQNAGTDFFPLERHSSQMSSPPQDENLDAPAALKATPLDAEDDHLRPGEIYAIYNTLDVLGSIPVQYEVVVRRAAHWAGVPEDYVAGVVERFERRLVRWWRREGKQQRDDESEE
ncbi:uncharacterized protein FIBRA_03670 [Fibroporia radiculosa]|uniref:RRN7-type domain-containing protein n=1 Tax=Fibroporia radiculosa TaxID=599839 RepID=J4GNL7_9APHY|nr:uncharacterized protein FIBRA_03670 [Fibroporia radiculosa]CCM01610.1 predicted protein [Fibroporia radiculosa]